MKKFIRNNKSVLITMVMSMIMAITGYNIVSAKIQRIEEVKQYRATIENLEYELDKQTNTNLALIYTNSNYLKEKEEDIETIAELKTIQDELVTKVEEMEAFINESQQYDANNYSRAALASKPLDKYAVITVDELNEWILQRAPEGSPFIGKAEMFLEASKESGLDPKYIIAHAGLESSWGRSPIAEDKYNFFGIAAYNHDPYNSAKSFSSFEEGIVQGAIWINENYIAKGQDTLAKMIYGSKSYCVENDGTPSQSWIDKIVNIIL